MKYFFLIIFFSLTPNCLLFAENPSIIYSETASSVFLDKGKKLFLNYCAHCHGNKGDGDGFNAEFLDKDPAQLSDLNFQAKRSNERLFRVINDGGAKVKKSHLMPAFGHTLSEEEIWALVAFVRYLGNNQSFVDVPTGVKLERPTIPEIKKIRLIFFFKVVFYRGR